MNDKIIEGLTICIKVARHLKENNFNDVMAIKQNTIIAFKPKSRLCNNSSIGYAHYHNSKPHRICIKQKALSERELLSTGLTRNDPNRVMLSGNWALAELITHELSHHRTKGHGTKFRIKYNKLMAQTSLYFISGDFYKAD